MLIGMNFLNWYDYSEGIVIDACVTLNNKNGDYYVSANPMYSAGSLIIGIISIVLAVLAFSLSYYKNST